MLPLILASTPLAVFLTSLLSKVVDANREVQLILCLSHTTFIRTLLAELSPEHSLLQPTLHLLNSSAQVQIRFCDTIPLLLAHLATLQSKQGTDIYVIHPLRLHKHTPAFSAQGLSRTFASLSDMTARTGAKVSVLEPADCANNGDDDPWSQRVPILGSGGKFAGQRGWVGRTVGVKRIVRRWCRFEDHIVQEG